MSGEKEIHRAENITITSRKIVSGRTTFAIDAIQSTWVGKYSSIAPLTVVLGFLALMFGGTMLSCTGMLIGAASGGLDDWSTKAWLAIACGVALLAFAKHIPPFHYIVHATIGGQATGIYRTPNLAQAQEIERAIAGARGL